MGREYKAETRAADQVGEAIGVALGRVQGSSVALWPKSMAPTDSALRLKIKCACCFETNELCDLA